MGGDLPPRGFVRRLARLAKERRRARRVRWRPSPPPPTLADVARAAAREGVARALDVLRAHRYRDLPPRDALEALPATVLLRAAAGHDARVRAALDFAARWHVPADLDRALARARRRLRPLRRAGCRAIDVAEPGDWAALEGALRARVGPAAAPAAPVPAPPAATRRRRRPVVLHPTGGLGNPLFQAAAALGYARRVGARLLLDARAYERAGAPRTLDLPRLRIDLPRATLVQVARALRRPHVEPYARRDEALLRRDDLEWVQGFWEDPVHLAGVEEDVREAFRPRDDALERAARAWVDGLRRAGAVAGVHVRRGDRVGGRPVSGAHRAPPLEFARRAVESLPRDARVVVFSDSPEDVAQAARGLALGERLVATAPATDPVFDLVALSACDHVVVSASTFSWWAAYLGERPGRIVCVPDPRTAYGPWHADVLRVFPTLPHWRVVAVPPRDLATLEEERQDGAGGARESPA
jgi:hypothetical protein